MTTMISIFLKELESEADATRRMLSRIPEDKYDWKPHEKSMSIRQLAAHIAELPGWVNMALHTEGLDFAANQYEPKVLKNNKELMAFFETTLAAAKADLEKAKDEVLNEKWVLRNGDTVLFESTKGGTIRMTYNQIVHHRAQMGVNFRLLDVAVPGTYGPTADEQF